MYKTSLLIQESQITHIPEKWQLKSMWPKQIALNLNPLCAYVCSLWMKGGYFLRIVKLIQRNLLLLCQVAFTILPLCTKVLCYTSVTCLVSKYRKSKGCHAQPWERRSWFCRLSQSHRCKCGVYCICSSVSVLYRLISPFFFLTLVSLQKVIFPNQDDCLISFLPLAHMFERLIEVS